MPLVSWRAKRTADVALRNGLVQGDGGYVHFRAILGGDFKHVLFGPLFAEGSHFDQYFSNGFKPPTS